MDCVVVVAALETGVGMGESEIDPWIIQLRKGIAEFCVLAAVQRLGEVYGYELVKFLAEHEGLDLTESTVYPLLTRLAKESKLSKKRKPSPNGPPRQYYRITDTGARAIDQMQEHLETVLTTIQNIRTE